MKKIAILMLLAAFSHSTLFANCKKCEIMNEYNKNHPSKYAYYEDYLKNLKEKGADAESATDLPPDVQMIMDQESVSAETPPTTKK